MWILLFYSRSLQHNLLHRLRRLVVDHIDQQEYQGPNDYQADRKSKDDGMAEGHNAVKGWIYTTNIHRFGTSRL